MRTDSDLALVERDGAVAHLVLNRPERRNALTGPLVQAFASGFDELNADDSINVIVVRGAGGAFCSGLDLKEFNADPQPSWIPEFAGLWRGVHKSIFDSNKIVIGALERAAVNGGAALALAADFLVAGETAFLQVGEVQQGMAAPMNTVWLALRHSAAVSARVALIGDRLVGHQLVELGIAHSSVPDDDVVSAASDLASRLAAHDPVGVARIKSSLRNMGPSGGDGEAWFARALTADPLAGRSMRPIAAKDR